MTVMVIDSDRKDNVHLSEIVKKLAPESRIICCDNAKKAIKSYEQFSADIVFLDEQITGQDWYLTAQAIRKINPYVNLILTVETGRFDNQMALELFRLYTSGCVAKPVTDGKIQEQFDDLRFPRYPKIQ